MPLPNWQTVRTDRLRPMPEGERNSVRMRVIAAKGATVR